MSASSNHGRASAWPRNAARERDARGFTSSAARWLLAALVVLASGLSASSADAQTPQTVDLVSAKHFADGRVVVGLRAQPPEALDVSTLSMSVDGVAREATSKPLVSEPKAIAVVIDTSGSMAGEPIFGARRAVSDLIRLLPPQDQVALIAFSDAPRLLVPFTSDRGVLLGASESLFAAGNTALFDAVAMGADLLASAPQSDRRLVLLSDGLDFGGTSKRDRAGSIEAVRASKSSVFAFGFGSETDRDYLATLARETNGSTREVADANSLRAVFTELGGLLSATHEVTVTTPLVATGEHRVGMAATAGGRRVTGERRFPVTNEGLLKPSMSEERSIPEQLVVALGSAVPLTGADVKVVAGDRAMTMVPGAQRVILDPWAFQPGKLELKIDVALNGAPVASTTYGLDVPELAPSLVVSPALASGSVQIRWRVQAATAPWVVRASAEGRELGRWEGTDSDATVAVPGGPVTIELLRPDGTVATQQTYQAPSGGFSPLLLLAALFLGAGGVGLLLLRRRQNTVPQYVPTNVTAMMRPRGTFVGSTRGAVVVVRGAASDEARYDIGQKPLTIGSAQECDIVVADSNVRPFHARLTLDRDGVLRVHGLRGKTNSATSELGPGDQWVRLERGDEMGIGDHLIRLESA